MIDRRELITVLRQIGIMMGAGVDFLQITAVLRAQTENPHLLTLYDALDHDLTMGVSIADAMARQPDIFSPFAVSLVRQIEMRNEMSEMAQDLAGAFLKIADYLQQDAALPQSVTRGSKRESATRSQPESERPSSAEWKTEAQPFETQPAHSVISVHSSAQTLRSEAPLTRRDLEQIFDNLQGVALRISVALAVLCSTLALVFWTVEAGLLERRWLHIVLWSVGALFLGGASLWMAYNVKTRLSQETRLSETPGNELGTTAKEMVDTAPTATVARSEESAPGIEDSGPGITSEWQNVNSYEALDKPDLSDGEEANRSGADVEDTYLEMQQGILGATERNGAEPLPLRRNWADMRDLVEDEPAATDVHNNQYGPAQVLINGQPAALGRGHNGNITPSKPAPLPRPVREPAHGSMDEAEFE